MKLLGIEVATEFGECDWDMFSGVTSFEKPDVNGCEPLIREVSSNDPTKSEYYILGDANGITVHAQGQDGNQHAEYFLPLKATKQLIRILVNALELDGDLGRTGFELRQLGFVTMR